MPLLSANVVGSGPNGLSAALTLALHGVRVVVFERNQAVGGACSTAELTLPGFHHDVGSSCFPMGVASPFFRSLPLEQHGLHWITPAAAAAHPLPDGTAAMLHNTLDATAAQFLNGPDPLDARHWKLLLGSTVRGFPLLVEDFTRPLLRIPSHPAEMATFGAAALWPAATLARSVFRGPAARALFGGCAAHSVLPFTHITSSATGLVLAAAGNAYGWPIAAGGAQSISNALASLLRLHGGEIVTAHPVKHLGDLPPADITLFDTSARALATIAEGALSPAFRTRLLHQRRGPGIFKIDYALSEPIPWRSPDCQKAATVHLGGSFEEMELSEHNAFTGVVPAPADDRLFVLVVQPSLFDPSRAPAGRHTAWAYCHTPAGCNVDRTQAIEAQMERFAPGFRQTVLARRTWRTDDLAAWNPNLLDGDISGGAMTLEGMVARPTLRTYRTSNPRLYLCSSAAPPGGGVHGMAGYNAAIAALQDHGLSKARGQRGRL